MYTVFTFTNRKQLFIQLFHKCVKLQRVEKALFCLPVKGCFLKYLKFFLCFFVVFLAVRDLLKKTEKNS